MRKIAIIGGGQAGLHLSFGLLDKGYDVTLYSDRTPDQVLHSKLASTAFLFDSTLAMERDLGLNFWEDIAPYGEGIHVDFRSPTGQIGLTVQGRLNQFRGQALDQRTKFARWLNEYVKRGGRLVVQSVSVADLETIAAANDLTMVAAGKGQINALFERDDRLSAHAVAPRHLAAVLVTGSKVMGDRPWQRIPFRPLRFNFIAGIGEYFSLPFYTHTKGECRSFLFEAVPGGPMDVFGDVRDGKEMVETVKRVIARFTPDDSHHVDDIEITDHNAWLKGSFVPTIRKPVGRLPSGGIVMAVGDTAVLNDPIAGQGANNASRMADHVLKRIADHGDRAFDAPWIDDVVATFWQQSGQFTTDFTNLLLSPPPPQVMELLGAASQNQRIADDFVGGFNNPPSFWPAIGSMDAAQAFIAERSCQHVA